MAQFLRLEWRVGDEGVLDQLAKACQAKGGTATPRRGPTEAVREISLGHTREGWSATYSPDGTQALSASDDKTVRVWNPATGACERVLEGHIDWVRSAACASPLPCVLPTPGGWSRRIDSSPLRIWGRRELCRRESCRAPGPSTQGCEGAAGIGDGDVLGRRDEVWGRIGAGAGRARSR